MSIALSTPIPLLPTNPNPSPPVPSKIPSLSILTPQFPHHHLLRIATNPPNPFLARSIHASITKTQNPENISLFNSLITTYTNIGYLADARKVLDQMANPNVVSFTALVSAYAKSGFGTLAIELFNLMRMSGIVANEFSFVAILTNCIRQGEFGLGCQVHGLAVKSGYLGCLHVCNALLGMYVKCGCRDGAEKLFGEMGERDVSSWNCVISGLVKDGGYWEGFVRFREMQLDGICGDLFTISTLLTAAEDGGFRAEGEAVHGYAIKTGLELDLSVGNSLIGFYTRFGDVDDVSSVFQRLPIKDVISWTGMLNAFMEFGLVESAMDIFDRMPQRSLITFNSLLAGLCKNDLGYQALLLFKKILQDGLEISDFTLTSALNACSLVSDTKTSLQLHAFLLKVNTQLSPMINACLIDMCTKCERMADAQTLFKSWGHDEGFLVAWTSMMSAHIRSGQPKEALLLIQTIFSSDSLLNIDEFAFATILGACSSLGFGDLGRQVHCHVVKCGLLSDLAVANAIFSMYAKCWDLENAIRFFSQMLQRDSVSWNSLISSYLLYRQGDRALDAWSGMEKSGVKPDSITFTLVISACRYTSSNSVSTCLRLFHSMSILYGIMPGSEHYAAMVDVFGYWDSFDQAEELIKKMPFKPDALVWRSLLNSCRLRSNFSLEREVQRQLFALEPQDASTYILLSNLYSATGRWHASEMVKQEMRVKGFKKHPALSWTILENMAHLFYARDRSHLQSKDIYSGLDILILQCMKVGYEPETSYVLHEVEEYQKRHFLFYHSAKLAVMYAILRAGPGLPVRVVKNIRLCGDCHTFLKYASSVTGREIMVRDTSGFHIFKGGECSCKDYW